MRNTFFIGVLLHLSLIAGAQQHSVKSPDGSIELTMIYNKEVYWALNKGDKQLIMPSRIGMELATAVLPAANDKIRKVETVEINEVVRPVVAHKNSEILDICNEMTIEFRSGCSLVFRVYNDGAAYRFKTDIKGNVLVMDELAEINFPPGTKSWYPMEEAFMSHNERTYIETELDTIREEHLASLPALFKSNDVNVLITETALEDYPGMWLRGNGSNSLKGVYPYYPDEEKLFGDRNLRIVSRWDFIAETKGSRSFPWRTFIITETDGGLVESNLTFLLADECRMENTDWIKPGKVAWDWWNNNNIYGVDFMAGINTESYEHYIDFAAEYGLEYIILDEGWYRLGDVLDVSPRIDIPRLCQYAAGRNVGIILWVVWNSLDNKLDAALAQYELWGVKGIKVDFMQRDDQKVVNYYWRVAERAAAHKLLVDYHGSYKPAGLRRAWPNVLTREGVKGLEHNKWSYDINPDHDLTIPFIRMVAGPMDYTPGAMVNYDSINFKPMFNRPASMGTRVHQMAMYVAYESPLQMLADSPSNYRKEHECTEFIAGVPVVWDETRVLEAAIGDYLVIARRSGEEWFLGAMTDWKEREFDIDLSFLEEGEYNAIVFSDGINADRYAQDYKKTELLLSKNDTLKIKMAPGGGYVARVTKK
ncbi:MAG: glycoside hydrolase family 97 protein [Bacteroidales bacterium]|nr:glycoside hydrolase family 97 protein [Bacteroidales bacterium]